MFAAFEPLADKLLSNYREFGVQVYPGQCIKHGLSLKGVSLKCARLAC